MAKPAKLVIGCKLPHGLILTVGGTSVELRGTNAVQAHDASVSEVAYGCGLTSDVDTAFFEAWCKLNKDNVALQNGLIFAQETTAEAKANAADIKDQKNGFEPLNGDNPGPGLEKVKETGA